MKVFVTIIFVLASCVVFSNAYSFDSRSQKELKLPSESTVYKGKSQCGHFFKYGSPAILNRGYANHSFYTCRRAYASMYDPNLKVPIWVAEHLNSSTIKGSANREGLDFVQDPLVPAIYQASHHDYYRSGYQKGHMAPAADFKGDQLALNESFLFTNSVPQSPQQNMRVWSYLEKSVRQLVRRRGHLFIVTGPVFLTPNPLRIKSSISVPDALYKIILDPTTDSTIGFIIPNNNNVSDDFMRYQTSVREIEKITKIDFNPILSRSRADEIENSFGEILMPSFLPQDRF